MKPYFFFIAFLSFLTTNAQVGIGNSDPKATLDITSNNPTSPSNTDGILIPRLDEFPSTDPGADQDGMLIFITGNGSATKGFYYWDNALANWELLNTPSISAANGLTEASNTISLGGALNQDTTITYGNHSITHNIDGTGSFNIQANGNTELNLDSSGNLNLGGVTEWQLSNTSASPVTRLNPGFYIQFLNSSGTVLSQFSNGGFGDSFISGARNFGLGLNNPKHKLDVVNNTTSSFDYIGNFLNSNTSGRSVLGVRFAAASPNTVYYYIQFFRNSSSPSGRITGNSSGTGVQYNTASDQRLKQNIEDINDPLNIIKAIKPRIYEYKEVPGSTEYGFIAQELQKVYPQAVSGSPDSDVTKDPMMVDYGRLTPILTAGIKELYKRFETLKQENALLQERLQKIEALEARLSTLEKHLLQQN